MKPALLFLLPAGLCLSACHRPAATDAAAPPAATVAPLSVKTAPAVRKPMPRYLRLTGELVAGTDADVAADTTGKVAATPVERGSVVRMGDVLVSLDSRSAELSLAEASASVALAKSRLALADSELARNEPLAKAKAIPASEFSKLQADREGRVADVAASEARRDLAVKTVSDTTIRAPFDGVVAERLVATGEYVMPSSTVVRLVSLDPLRLRVNISEPDISAASAGQAMEFTVAPWPGETFPATVKHIGAAVRSETRDLTVEADVANKDGRLKPGLFADARLVLTPAPAVAVPDSALRRDGTRVRLWVLAGDTLSERLVETGESADGLTEITTGIAEGESVVLSPGDGVGDGVPARAAAAN